MASTSTYIASSTLPTPRWTASHRRHSTRPPTKLKAQQEAAAAAAAAAADILKQEVLSREKEGRKVVEKSLEAPKSQDTQPLARSKNMGREYGGQWLSCCTRHVRIYAAYIDPVTYAFDQTQMDKLTLILDPSNEFVWNTETCNKVYSYFQELVDHYEGAPLTEYTLRLIGSDLEHYIRKLLYEGDIKYNMSAKVLNFSMGKPRVLFNNNQLPNVQ